LELENTYIRIFPEPIACLLDLKHLLLSNKSTNISSTSHQTRDYFKRDGLRLPHIESHQSQAFQFQLNRDQLLMKNSLWTLPTCVSSLAGLVKLEAVDVGLTDLPDSIGTLKNLKILDISRNNLSWIPSSFIDLKNLIFCNLSKNGILRLPLDLETMEHLSHLFVSFNMLAELPEDLHLLKGLQTLDVYENQISTVPKGFDQNDLVRFDMAQNDITVQQFIDQTNQEAFSRYLKMQNSIRTWSCELEISRKENYQLDSTLLQERRDFRLVLDEKSQDLIKSLTSDSEDDLSDHNDEEYLETINKETHSLAHPIDTEEKEEDWACQMQAYSPTRPSYSHNLLRMDQENWWGSDQFCPADLHATPRNEILLKNWERDRQLRMMRHIGKRNRRSLQQSSDFPLIIEGQFDDAD